MDIGELVSDGQLLVAVLIALAAGVVSFLSPCILPLVPGYLAYVSASAGSDTGSAEGGDAGSPVRSRMVLGSLLFVLGFTVVLVGFLALWGSLGVWLLEWEQLITRIMGVVIILMGLVFVGLLNRLQGTSRLRMKPKLGVAGAPILGAVFAIGWTPCMGPTLTVIMGLSLQQGSVGRSVILAVFYSLGLGLPFVLAAFGFRWMTETMTFFKRHIRAVNVIGGSFLILIGILMVTGLWTQMMYALQGVIGGYVTPI